DPFMAAVAERLVLGLPASAQGDDRTPGEAEGGAGGVKDLEIALDADGPVVLYREFGGCHLLDGSTVIVGSHSSWLQPGFCTVAKKEKLRRAFSHKRSAVSQACLADR